MDIAVLIARLALAAVFAVAGVTKLADRAGARKAAVDFGVPETLAAPVGLGLPFVELAVAALLLFAGTARWGAAGSIALLVVFSAAIGVAMARGRAPDCHCFGQLHSEPAGWKALARNGLLGGLAVFVAVAGWSDPGPGAFAWIGRLHGAGVVAVAVGAFVLVAGVLGGRVLLHLLSAYGRVLVRLERLESVLADAGFSLDEPDEAMPEIGREPGTPAPAFSLQDILGETVTLDGLLEPGLPLLLLFTSPSCGPCHALIPTIAGWQREHADTLTVALVNDGDEDAIRATAAEHALERVLLDDKLSVYGAYQANGTPSAVLVSPDQEIASWVASGSSWIEHLVRRSLPEAGLDDADSDGGLAVGEPAPEFVLPDLEGHRVELAELRGTDAALLFWNPACGYCRDMHEDLRSWEADPPKGSPALVVVSSGEAEATAGEGFTSRVLLDSKFEAGGLFGAGGTPTAVRIDAAGNIASPLVVGKNAVLELLGRRQD